MGEGTPGNPQVRGDGNTVWPAGGQPGGAFFDDNPASSGRIDAANPTAAAVQVSRMRFADGSAPTVVLARDDTFADALSGSSLTGYGPLLFTGRDSLPADSRAELDRVLPAGGQVWILGGTAAVSQAVESDLTAAGYTVLRFGGADRIETSLAIADHLWSGPFSPTGRNDAAMVIVARAFPRADDVSGTSAWADAIAGAAPAAARRIPRLLMDGDRGDSRVNDWIAARQGTTGAEAVLLGGRAAISDAAEATLTAPFQRYRLAGSTRAGTAVQAGVWGNGWTASHLTPDRPSRFLVIDGFRGDGWAWGLAAAGIAADTNARLLMTSAATLPTESLATARSCDTPSVDLLLIGNEQVVPGSVAAQLDTVDGVDCQPFTAAAASMCDMLDPVFVGAFQNDAYDINEPWLGGADTTVIETGGIHNCTFRIDYMNATATRRAYAGNPGQFQIVVGPPVGGTPLSAEEQNARCSGPERRGRISESGFAMCADPGLAQFGVGIATSGRGVAVNYDAGVLLETARERFPAELMLDLMEHATRSTPSPDVLEGQPCFSNHPVCQ